MHRRLVVLSLVFLTGCASGNWDRSVSIVNEHDCVVEVERWTPKDDTGALEYNHPSDIPATELAFLLGELKFEQTTLFKRSSVLPVVSPELVDPLATALADGLSQSGPSERVRFQVKNAAASLFFLPSTRTTRGVIFEEPKGTVNLAFDLVNEPTHPDDEEIYGDWGNPTRYVYTRRKLILPDGVELYAKDGKTKDVWVTVDRSRLDGKKRTEAKPTTPEPMVTTTVPSTPADPVSDPPTIDAEPKPNTNPEPPAKKPLTDQEVLARLRFLEELYREQKISAEDYEKKRRELLSGEQ